MDWVELWRAVGIVGTGVSGTVGLLTDYRDRSTGRVTRMGVLALGGIATMTVGGLAAFLVENGREADKAQRAAATTTEMVQTLRALTVPLAKAELEVSFAIPCNIVSGNICRDAERGRDFIRRATERRILDASLYVRTKEDDGGVSPNAATMRGQATLGRILAVHYSHEDRLQLAIRYRTRTLATRAADDVYDLASRSVDLRVDRSLMGYVQRVGIAQANGTMVWIDPWSSNGTELLHATMPGTLQVFPDLPLAERGRMQAGSGPNGTVSVLIRPGA